MVCNKQGVLPASSTVQEGKNTNSTAEKGEHCPVVILDFENLHLEHANSAANFLNDDGQMSLLVCFGITVAFRNFYHQHIIFRRKTRTCSCLPLEKYFVTCNLKLQLSIILGFKYTSQRAH